MKSWHLETRNIKDLSNNPKNPRKITKEMTVHLNNAIEKFGLIDKPIITKEGQIIGGHQRIKILKSMKSKTVECWVCDNDLTSDEIDELMLGLNLHRGEFDTEKLIKGWEIQKLLNLGFKSDDFSDFDPKALLGLDSEKNNEILEPPKNPKTQLGDLYELDLHRLKCGDSTNPEDVNDLLQDSTPILMVTDPPYGVNYDPSWSDGGQAMRSKRGKKQNTKAFGKVKNDNRSDWSMSWFLFPGSIAYIWHSGKHSGIVEKSLTDSDYEIKSQIIWIKNNFAISRGDYHWQHEPCFYAIKKGQSHNWQGARAQSTVWEIQNLNAWGKNKTEPIDERTCHSTQKPYECMARPIQNNSAPGDIVYDPFLGSGTTLIAAEKLQRICYGMELDPAYCDIIVERWEKFTGKKAKLIPKESYAST